MRISSFEIHRQAADQLQALGAEVARTQQQISSGKRIADPSDDPVGASRSVELKQALGVRAQYQTNAGAADNALSLEDSVLGRITDLIHRVQELTIQSGSGVNSAADRQFIAAEIETRFDELLSLVNTRSADGQYIFAGYKSDTQPFEVIGGSIIYHGDDGQRQIQIDQGQTVSVNDSGDRLFMRVDSGKVNATASDLLLEPARNNASATKVSIIDQDLASAFHPDKLIVEFRPLAEGGGVPNYTVVRRSDQRPVDGLVNVPFADGAPIEVQGIGFSINGAPIAGDQFVIETNTHRGLLETVQEVATGLNFIDAEAEPEAFSRLLDDTIGGLDSALNSILEVRAEVGARLNSVDSAKNLHQDLTLQMQEVLSSIEDLDFAEAVSNLSYQSFILEAAQQSFVRINGLSLFNALR